MSSLPFYSINDEDISPVKSKSKKEKTPGSEILFKSSEPLDRLTEAFPPKEITSTFQYLKRCTSPRKPIQVLYRTAKSPSPTTKRSKSKTPKPNLLPVAIKESEDTADDDIQMEPIISTSYTVFELEADDAAHEAASTSDSTEITSHSVFEIMSPLCPHLDHQTLASCRLVCQTWNKQIINSVHFLQQTIFTICPTLELVNMSKNTSVKWHTVKCQHILPCPESWTARTYQEKYLVSQLNTSHTHKNFMVGSINWIILDQIAISKENLLKWVTSCTQLSKLTIQKCTFQPSKTNWTEQTRIKVTDKLRDLQLLDLDLLSLVDVGKFILDATKKLKALEISQSFTEPPSVQKLSLLRIKTLEEDFGNIVSESVERNASTLRSLHLSLALFKHSSFEVKAFHKIGRLGLNLEQFGFKVNSVKNKFYSLNLQSKGFDVVGTVHRILKTSINLWKLDVPSLLLDITDRSNLCWTLSPKLVDIGSQFVTSFAEGRDLDARDLHVKFRSRLHNLRKVTVYRGPTKAQQFSTLSSCLPWLKELDFHAVKISDAELQGIIINFRWLVRLTLDRVFKLSDFGISGISPESIDNLDEIMTELGSVVGSRSSASLANVKFAGQPLSNLIKLRILKISGDFLITDLGIAFGLNLPYLEVLELVGSNLRATETGLNCLANNCPKMKSVKMKMTQVGSLQMFDQFSSKLTSFCSRTSHLELN